MDDNVRKAFVASVLEQVHDYNYGTETIEHHGIKGQKWGVRRFQNKDGSLTSTGRTRNKENRRLRNADKTRDDVQSVVDSLSEKDKSLLGLEKGQKEYMTKSEGKRLAKRFIERNEKGKPVGFMDIEEYHLNDGATVGNVSIAVRGDEHGKGYGKKLSAKGSKWIDKNIDKFDEVQWATIISNVCSKRLAEENGWKKAEAAPGWARYIKSKG